MTLSIRLKLKLVINGDDSLVKQIFKSTQRKTFLHISRFHAIKENFCGEKKLIIVLRTDVRAGNRAFRHPQQPVSNV